MITINELATEILVKLESIRDKVEPDAIGILDEAIDMAKCKSKFTVKHLGYGERIKMYGSLPHQYGRKVLRFYLSMPSERKRLMSWKIQLKIEESKIYALEYSG